MKFIIMAVVAIVLLGAGAGGAYFFLDKPAEAAGGPADEIKKAEHEAKAEEAKKEGGEPVKPSYVKMGALNLPIIDENGVTQIVSLVVSIEVPAAENVSEVEDLRPRLNDAFIQDMYGALNRKNAMHNGVIQVDAIKERLNRVCARVVGKEKVKDVLLEVVQQRSL